jgi:uncharacterized protein
MLNEYNSPSNRLVRILSLDGGGIRGIIPAQILVSLEKKLQRLTQNPQAKIADFFDLIAGTSTGGILACLYLAPDKANPTRPLYSAEDAVNLYMQFGEAIFSTSFYTKMKGISGLFDEKYDVDNLEAILDKYFGNLELKELIKPCLITAFDVYDSKAHFFRQHYAQRTEGRNYYVKDVARATAAAPTYFEAAKITSLSGVTYPLIDGGVFANNPTLCAYAEAHQMDFGAGGYHPTAKNMLLFSLGNGNLAKMKYQHKDVKNWGALEWIKPLINIMMSGVGQTVDYQLKQIFSAAECPNQYIRIEPELNNAKPEMDDASPQNLQALREAGTKAAERDENEEKLERLAKMLIENQ